MGNKRLDSIPDVPTTAELGFNAAESFQMCGLLAPKMTPMPVVEKLRQVMAKSVKDPSFINVLNGVGEEVVFLNGDELGKYIDKESETIGKIMVELVKDSSTN